MRFTHPTQLHNSGAFHAPCTTPRCVSRTLHNSGAFHAPYFQAGTKFRPPRSRPSRQLAAGDWRGCGDWRRWASAIAAARSRTGRCCQDHCRHLPAQAHLHANETQDPSRPPGAHFGTAPANRPAHPQHADRRQDHRAEDQRGLRQFQDPRSRRRPAPDRHWDSGRVKAAKTAVAIPAATGRYSHTGSQCPSISSRPAHNKVDSSTRWKRKSQYKGHANCFAFQAIATVLPWLVHVRLHGRFAPPGHIPPRPAPRTGSAGRFHDRIADRNRHSAVSAPPPQDEPANHRHVVPDVDAAFRNPDSATAGEAGSVPPAPDTPPRSGSCRLRPPRCPPQHEHPEGRVAKTDRELHQWRARDEGRGK